MRTIGLVFPPKEEAVKAELLKEKAVKAEPMKEKPKKKTEAK